MRVYLIAPAPDFGRDGLDEDSAMGLDRPVAMQAAAGIATVAAYFPDEVDLRLCDEIIEPVDYDDPADYVAISVNVAQVPRAMSIARAFRAKGIRVVLGGPHVSLAPDLFEGTADCLVVGEFEPVAGAFMEDLLAGRLKPRYDGSKADLAATLPPRWDLYDNERALAGVVQTSRGCPFECNFCDVIQYLGRVQRHKPAEKVVQEVQTLYDLGYRQINLSDDNFTVYRQRTSTLLSALADWNAADGRQPVSFMTQMSIDVAKSPDLLAKCSQAGLRFAFVGLETSSEEALTESRKRQNLRVDLVEQCMKVVGAGVSMTAGLMLGFDSDDLSCFERQFSFAMTLPIVMYRPAVLVAPVATPLYDAMKAAGRIVEDVTQTRASTAGTMTNIQPMQMTRAQLAEGTDWLKRSLLDPENAIRRFELYARVLGDCPPHLVRGIREVPTARSGPLIELLTKSSRDRGARRVIECVSDLSRKRPLTRGDLMQALGLYLNSYARQQPWARAGGTARAVA
ncbi:radical SAM superfamily enzyme YgiQ (UPF0313 family) [Methylorubrum rhodinum]|uniref:Radical SAM superfamily enzyme YgiQ (UPF0313 family) n=1 Tax=Methylorubrum rhodinum TaxID=29428 RepID=A0A840ZM93_9HYPH|nr:radical SAM protein [Methylorubrum rhodinum]MBB5758195.1 radical SAM superfamily enzyme YgiQ (UPF0313 family) [Methylorubrum rhodinum]